ncbi:hypothetical protein CAEBREN_13802 [Caenorhabditis brenneri]|uniref:Uncharacterized protein n=1 Tax=Caenorhabditis brenneri TaxID=135651 RepID=G0MGC7_CAEBE|nr:hypothetical protein CAEBREN_13802 [Caenorhabditis brenneri]
MTVYFVQTAPLEIESQILAECSDLIISTADFFEHHYLKYGTLPNVPMFTHKWLSHLIPRLSAHRIPLTEKHIIGSAYFTFEFRFKFPGCCRNMFYFPKPRMEEKEEPKEEMMMMEEEEEPVEEPKKEQNGDAFWDNNNFIF